MSFRSPNNNDRVDSNEVKFKIRVTSIDDVVKVDVLVNGQVKKTLTGNQKEIEDLLTLPDGVYELSATATNSKGKTSTSNIKIGVKVDPNAIPTETPTPTIIIPTVMP